MNFFCASPLQCLPKVVLIDLDDTLYPYSPAHAAAISAASELCEHRLQISSQRFAMLYDHSRKLLKERLPKSASSHSRLLYFQGILDSLQLGSNLSFALELENTYWQAFMEHVVPFNSVVTFLERLKSLAIPVVVLTDLTSNIQFRKIIKLGLSDYFDYIVTSEEAGADKPQCNQFDLALSKVGLPAADVWMLGDNPATDMKGAKTHLAATTFQKVPEQFQPNISNKYTDVAFSNYLELIALIDDLAASRITGT